MHLRLRQLGTVCLLTLALTRTAFAQQDEEKTPLGKKMSAMNAAFKAVGRQIDDPSKNANTLEQIAIIETNAKEALKLEPEKKKQIPAAEQAKFVTDYQAGIKEFLVTVDKLKSAVKAGKNTDAVAIIDAMKDEQKAGHKDFRIKKAGAPPALR
jgi:soluble cytochrome b562